MKRILIYGLKDPIGGVETLVFSYTGCFPREQIVCDYIIFGDTFSHETEIINRGGKVFYLPNRIKSRDAYFKALHAIFKENRYDAVWANFAGLTNIDVLVLGKEYGVPIRIAHSHGAKLYWTGLLMKYLVPFFHALNKRRIDQYATHFWACSDLAGKFMFPHAVHDRLTVVHNAVDTDRFYESNEKRGAMRKTLGVEKALVVSHVARMSAEKNQSFLLEVFKELHDRRSDARLLMVGDGDLMETLVNKATALGIRDQVVFTGFQTDVADYYRASDVFFMPSLSEGLGLGLIEAQACGIPCVTSHVVPHETNVTGCVRYVPLDESIDTWCDALLEMSDMTIPHATLAVQNAGYSIQTEAKKLGQFFIERDSYE